MRQPRRRLRPEARAASNLSRYAAAVLVLGFAITIANVGLTGLCPTRCADALTFDGNFNAGLSAWTATGGGAQCANYGTPSQNQRRRGNFVLERGVAGPGVTVGRFDLPPSAPSLPLQGCELTHPVALDLGSDQYYGYMFYVPHGWRTGTRQFWGIAVAQFHFQNIWGSPIQFQLHNDHMTVALETGACSNYLTAKPGCRYRSNGDVVGCVSNAHHTCLPALYAIPSPMRQGAWHELIMHVHWASDSSGQIQVWHRLLGQDGWRETVNLRGHPTVQWDITHGCCYRTATDKVGAYRGQAKVPVSVWEDNILVGPDFAVVAANMYLSGLVRASAAMSPLAVATAAIRPRSSARLDGR